MDVFRFCVWHGCVGGVAVSVGGYVGRGLGRLSVPRRPAGAACCDRRRRSMAALARQPSLVRQGSWDDEPPQEEQTWDVFIGHSRRSAHAVMLAEAIYAYLTARCGVTVWLDVKMADRSEAAMEHGVRASRCFLAIVTGACVNADRPDDDPAGNAYFRRPYCLKELRWAAEAAKPIQPIVRAEDKQNIGTFLEDAPDDLQFLGGIGEPLRARVQPHSLSLPASKP